MCVCIYIYIKVSLSYSLQLYTVLKSIITSSVSVYLNI